MTLHAFKILSDLMLLQVSHSEIGFIREAGQLTKCSIGRGKAS